MRKSYSIITAAVALLFAPFAGLHWMQARSAGTLLESMRNIRPHAPVSEVTKTLGTPDYTYDAPNLPPWLKTSAIGEITRGSVLVYSIKRYPTNLLIIHFLPDSGVQFVTWEPT